MTRVDESLREMLAGKPPIAALARHWWKAAYRRWGRFWASTREILRRVVWLARWRKRTFSSRRRTAEISQTQHGLTSRDRFVIPTVYINLTRRADRKQSIEKELRALDLDFVRFAAVDGLSLKTDGLDEAASASLACAMSHRDLLQTLQSPGPALMVVEDDLILDCTPAYFSELVAEFLRDARLDVLCLAYNLSDRPVNISKNLAISQAVSTTACYVLKERARDPLVQSFGESVQLFIQGESVQRASIDQHWKKLQRNRLMFAVPRRRIAVQGRSYSDITGKVEDRGV